MCIALPVSLIHSHKILGLPAGAPPHLADRTQYNGGGAEIAPHFPETGKVFIATIIMYDITPKQRSKYEYRSLSR